LAADLFHTEAWFALLLAHGFERAPQRVHSLPLRSVSGSLSFPGSGAASSETEAYLNLMQATAGAPLTAMANYYSCLYGPASLDGLDTSGGADSAAGVDWVAVAQALRRLPGSAVVRLQPLDAEADWLAGLEGGLRAVGYRTSRFFAFGNWYQPVPAGGFVAYWLQRPSALRNSTDRGKRRLSKAGDWTIDIVAQPGAELEAALAAYQAVYAQSWKQPEPCLEFIPELVKLAAERGWLRLGVLRLNGEPLAAQLWLTCGGKANIYKLAYVKGVEKLSAGSVLTQALMQHAMDVDRVTEVDYLSGDDAYKADWMAQRRERVGLEAFDMRRAAGLLAVARHRAAIGWHWLKKPWVNPQ
jgi:hypothetical protein